MSLEACDTQTLMYSNFIKEITVFQDLLAAIHLDVSNPSANSMLENVFPFQTSKQADVSAVEWNQLEALTSLV